MLGNWFWQMRLVVCRFYCLEMSLKGFIKIPYIFGPKKKKIVVYVCVRANILGGVGIFLSINV